MLFSEKENVFMYLVAFQKMFRKIFSSIWLCSWKYHRKHIFYLLLTFSHIFSVAKRIYSIIHSSIQKHKQNLEKKLSNPITFSRLPNNRNTNKHRNTNIPVKYRNTNIFWVRRGAAIAQSTVPIAIGAKARSRSARCFAQLQPLVEPRKCLCFCVCLCFCCLATEKMWENVTGFDDFFSRFCLCFCIEE